MKSQKLYAEIIKEYTFGEYELTSIYKFLPKNIPDKEKNMYASALLSRALQAAYISLLNPPKNETNSLNALIQTIKKTITKQ